MSADIGEQYDKVYRYCSFKVHDKRLAEDLTQETFLRYFMQHSYIHRGKQLAYLYTIARNLCIDYYRRHQEEGLKEEIAENPMEGVENSLQLRMAVEKLPERMQELILLRYVNEVSIKEICRIMGMSRSSIYRMEQEALERLRKMLSV